MASVEQILNRGLCLRKKAKTLLAFALVTAAMSHCAKAQTFAEWFSQKKTQKKYLLQQIAALQMYSGYLHQGYTIAKGGLGSIGGYIGNEFGSHSGYYSYLRSPSQPIRNDPQVKDILRRQQDILQCIKASKSQNGLSSAELNYVKKVCEALLRDCDGQLHDLQIVLSDQKTSMSDEERFRQITRLHQAMEDNYRFVTNFNAQLQIYVDSRQRELKNVNHLNQLYASY